MELQRHQRNAQKAGSHGAASTLPPYNLKLVRESIQDVHTRLKEVELEIQAVQMAAADDADSSSAPKNRFAPKPSILLHDTVVRRHKRCLLAYHHYRAQALQKQVANLSVADEETLSHLTQNAPELEFAKAYHTLRNQYLQTVLPPDLNVALTQFTSTLAPPAATRNVQVRCVKTLGQVVLESGKAITLTRGTVLYLPTADIWDFLQDGTLQVLEGEEVDF